MTRFLKFAPLATMAILPLPALAQSQLDRLETISEMSNDLMVEIMVNEIATEMPEARDTLLEAAPDGVWDDEMRAAGTCMLDAYEDRIGPDGVDDLLASMESYLDEVQGLSLDEMEDAAPDLPDGMTEEANMRIAEDCGMMELQIARMQESGFMDAVMAAAMAADN